MDGTKVRKCSCVSAFQDEKYGMNMRLMNATTSGYRCTVCHTNVGATPNKNK